MSDLTVIIEQGKIIFSLAAIALGSGVITSAVTELLKWKVFLSVAKKWPRTVAAITSIGVSIAAVALSGDLRLDNIATIVAFAFIVFMVATQSYDAILKRLYEAVK